MLSYTVRTSLANSLSSFFASEDFVSNFFFLAVQAGFADLVLERLREMSHCPLSTVRPDVNLKSKPVLRRGPAGEDANSRKSLFEVPIIDLNKTLLSLC